MLNRDKAENATCIKGENRNIPNKSKFTDRITRMHEPSDVIQEALRSRRADVERVAESVGVAAQAVGSAVLTADQLHLVASGLRDVQEELHDLSDTLRSLAGGVNSRTI
jgi:hypothetical protein